MVTLWEPKRLRGTYSSRDYQITTPRSSPRTKQLQLDDALGVAMHTKQHRPQAAVEQAAEECRESEAELIEELPLATQPKSRKRKSRKQHPLANKKAAAASSYLLSKLWEPPNVTRTKNDICELDICLTLYNQEMQQAIEDEEDTVIREVLYKHLTKTRRTMLSHIKHAHMFLTVQSKLEKAQARQKKLQKALHM